MLLASIFLESHPLLCQSRKYAGLAYFRPVLRLWFLLTNCLNPWQKHDPAYFGNWPPWPVRSTSNPQAHSLLHQPNLAPPQCTPNWYASQAQEESSTWSITIGKLHNHTSTTDKKRLTLMYHRNEFVFMVLPCYPIFSLVHVLLFPTYQGTRREFFSYSFFLVISLAILDCGYDWYFLQIQSLHCSIAKKHLQGQFWFSLSPRWRFCLSDVSVCTSWIITKIACTELCVGCFQLPLMHHTTHTPSLEHSHLFVFFCVADTNRKKTLSHSRLPPRVKKPVANCKYLWFSIRNHLLEITNICDLLPIGTDDVIYDHFLGRNPYISKRPKKQWIS